MFSVRIMGEIHNSLRSTFLFTLVQQKGVLGSLLRTTLMALSGGYQLKWLTVERSSLQPSLHFAQFTQCLTLWLNLVHQSLNERFIILRHVTCIVVQHSKLKCKVAVGDIVHYKQRCNQEDITTVKLQLCHNNMISDPELNFDCQPQCPLFF